MNVRKNSFVREIFSSWFPTGSWMPFREIMERNDRKALDEWIHRQRSSWAVIRADKPLWNQYELLHQESECSEMELRKCVDAMLRMGTVIIELAQKERRSSDESICD